MSILTNLARSAKVELIAHLASSYEAFDGGTLIKNVSSHNIRDYFRKYGSNIREVEYISEHDTYVGYVNIKEKPEFLSAIVLFDGNAVASAFDSIDDQGDEFSTLMAKKEFADNVSLAVRRAAARMKVAAMPPPQPQPQPQPAPPQPSKPGASASAPLRGMDLLFVALSMIAFLMLILALVDGIVRMA